MEKGLLIEGIAKNVLVMLPKAKAIFKDTYGKKPQLNLRGIQILIINIIHNEGPMSMGKLSSIVSIAKANTTPLVADLIEKGYLCRRRYEKDRRVILIGLTEEGRQVQRMVQQENIAFFKSKLGAFETEDLARLNDVVLSLTSLFDRWLETPPAEAVAELQKSE